MRNSKPGEIAVVDYCARTDGYGGRFPAQDLMKGKPMEYLSTTAALGHCTSVRRHLTTGVTSVSAGILALGLVAAPPDVRGTGPEVRQVQLAALVLSPPALLSALEKLISGQPQGAVPLTRVVDGGVADIPTAALRDRRTQMASGTTQLSTEAAMMSEQISTAAIVPPNPALLLNAFAMLLPVPLRVPFLVFVAIPLDFILVPLYHYIVLPIANAVNAVLGAVGVPALPAALGVVTAGVDETATLVPSLTSSQLATDFATVPTPTARQAGVAPARPLEKADSTEPVTPNDTEQVPLTEPASVNQQLSTDAAISTTDVTKTDAVDGAAAARGLEPVADESRSEPQQPTVRRATPGTLARGSLDVGERPRDLRHRGPRDDSTTRTAATGDGVSTAGSPSAASPAASSPTDSAPSGGDSEDS
ncbi:hypothetical protein ACFQWH_01745 [Mycolicibacterium sp. GCM10028919]|uniref:hypothetical protein n=1 Tax=Mycolicibacterium sp. GCM10028919 TaxID=3273401 RepID=UPI003612A741